MSPYHNDGRSGSLSLGSVVTGVKRSRVSLINKEEFIKNSSIHAVDPRLSEPRLSDPGLGEKDQVQSSKSSFAHGQYVSQ